MKRRHGDTSLAHEVIESIVTLTEMRERRSLEKSLLSTLREMLTHVEGWLLIVPSSGCQEGCSLLHGNPDTLTKDVVAMGCAMSENDEPKLATLDGQTYLIAKLRDAENDRLHLLILAQKQWADIDRLLAQGMLRVYQNFVDLLYDSEKDTLTGLFNRRKLEAKLREFEAAHHRGRRKNDETVGDYLAIMDLDRFKRINDTYGHLIGDEVLLVFANIMRNTLRERDTIFRYGGEEFVALLQDVPHAAIADIVDRVRGNVEKHAFPVVGQVTVSIGYAALNEDSPPLTALNRADRALYYAKDSGRNRAHQFEKLVEAGILQDATRDGSIELF